MKIVHILLGKANPERMNGVNKIAHQMAVAQAGAGFDVTVVGLSREDTNSDHRPYKLGIIRQHSSSFILSSELKEFIKTIKQDTIIHFHGVLIPVFYSLSILLRRKNIPYVVTPHGALQTRALKNKKWLKYLYIHLFEKLFLKKAKVIQAITSYECSCIDRITDTEIKLVPNAYPFMIFEQKPLDNAEVVFGYIGRLDKNHKGLDVLIDAFSLFYDRNKKGYLYIVGDGKDRKWLFDRIVSRQLESRVIFTGEKHGIEKREIINKTDIFIVPSRWDVLPTSVLETCAHAKPCIVTEATGFGEMVKVYNAGITISKTDTHELALAMEDYSDLKKKGKNAESMVKQEYNWSKVAHMVLSDLYGCSYD